MIVIIIIDLEILNMKKTVLLVAFSMMFVSQAFAGLNCSTDYFGNTTCYGTGEDSGYSSTTSEDYFGNTTTRDNSGNTTTCSTDYFGNVTCN